MSKATGKPSGKPKAAGGDVALVGGNLPDGTRFEKGDKLVVTAEQRADLLENGVIAEEGDV